VYNSIEKHGGEGINMSAIGWLRKSLTQAREERVRLFGSIEPAFLPVCDVHPGHDEMIDVLDQIENTLALLNSDHMDSIILACDTVPNLLVLTQDALKKARGET
jgi:hypothetical protein